MKRRWLLCFLLEIFLPGCSCLICTSCAWVWAVCSALVLSNNNSKLLLSERFVDDKSIDLRMLKKINTSLTSSNKFSIFYMYKQKYNVQVYKIEYRVSFRVFVPLNSFKIHIFKFLFISAYNLTFYTIWLLIINNLLCYIFM